MGAVFGPAMCNIYWLLAQAANMLKRVMHRLNAWHLETWVAVICHSVGVRLTPDTFLWHIDKVSLITSTECVVLSRVQHHRTHPGLKAADLYKHFSVSLQTVVKLGESKKQPETETVCLHSKSCAHISNFYCEGEQTPFLVGVALFAVSMQNSE